MKKALSITLAGTLFTIEEDAYEKLSEYLKSIQGYFGTYPESVEIIKDIEARMAEQLMTTRENPTAVVTITDIEKLIAVMGRVEDFEDKKSEGDSSKEKPESSENQSRNTRRIMRDPDDAIIAGVASGLAHYVGIDATWMRVIFIIISILMGGAGGIIIYIILALIIPKAETPAEKVMMRGGPINLESFKENIGEMASNIKKNSEGLFDKNSKPRNFLDQLFRLIGKIIVMLIKIIATVVGIGITIACGLGIAALIFASIVVLFNGSALGDASAVYTILPHTVYFTLVTSIFIAAIIPLILLSTLGKFLFKSKRPHWRPQSIISLIVVWIIALALTASILIRYIPEIKNTIEAAPEFQKVSKVIEVKDFTKLNLDGVSIVHLSQGTTTSLTVTSRQRDVDQTSFEVVNNTLSYERMPRKDFCFFCNDTEQLEMTITMPKLESIEATDVVTIDGTKFTVDDLSLIMSDVSKINLPVVAKNIDITASDVAHVTLTGSTTKLKAEVSGVAKINTKDLSAKDVVIETTDASQARVYASSTLSATARDISTIRYSGNPQVTSDVEDHAQVRAE